MLLLFHAQFQQLLIANLGKYQGNYRQPILLHIFCSLVIGNKLQFRCFRGELSNWQSLCIVNKAGRHIIVYTIV